MLNLVGYNLFGADLTGTFADPICIDHSIYDSFITSLFLFSNTNEINLTFSFIFLMNDKECPMCKSNNYDNVKGCKDCGFAGLCRSNKE